MRVRLAPRMPPRTADPSTPARPLWPPPRPAPGLEPPAAPAADPAAASAEPELLRVGQIAERTGKTVRALRFYEELGLLTPAQRTKGGFREYDEGALLRIQWIDRLQELGFSLQDIRDFLSSLRELDSGPAAMDQLRTFYARKMLDTRQQISRLQALEAELKDSLSYLSTCRVCAPETPKSTCRSCGEQAHRDAPAPALVAAVHEPA